MKTGIGRAVAYSLCYNSCMSNTTTSTSITPEQLPLKTSLFYTSGASDKEYHAQLLAEGSGYVVHFQYGRRGGTLTEGTKTKAPVAFEKAVKVFESLLAEKIQKGYTQDTTGAIFGGSTQGTQEFTGILPQLLNPITADDAEHYIQSSDWIAEEKYDGVRRIMDCTDTDAQPGSINRKGLRVGMPIETATALAPLGQHAPYQLDGELVGSVFYVFDVLQWDGRDCRSDDAETRSQRLNDVQAAVGTSTLVITAPVARTVDEKRALVAELQGRRAEGIVFKKQGGTYIPGRPASGGDQVKWKFVKTATFVVLAHKDDKRSVQMGLVDATRNLGFVTIPVNYNVPAVGALIEVEYLYAYPNGALAQPVYRGERDDLDKAACVEAQLIFKADGANDEEN